MGDAVPSARPCWHLAVAVAPLLLLVLVVVVLLLLVSLLVLLLVLLLQNLDWISGCWTSTSRSEATSTATQSRLQTASDSTT